MERSTIGVVGAGQMGSGIAQVVAQLRGMEVAELAQATTRNAIAALPRLQALLS